MDPTSPREDWTISHLINLRPGWQVNLDDGQYVVVATGDTIDEALEAAADKIDCGRFAGEKFKPIIDHITSKFQKVAAQASGSALLERLGLKRKFQRRF